LLFSVIAVAVDSSEKTDDFVKSGSYNQPVIKKYYLGFVPLYMEACCFHYLYLSLLFFFTSPWLQDPRSLQILASGTSYNKSIASLFFWWFIAWF
jgi:lipopolysaccharide export system permease protein